MKNLNPNVFRKAARVVFSEREYCCCPAITTSVIEIDVGNMSVYHEYFTNLFKSPYHRFRGHPDTWWANPWKTQKDQAARIFALLLAAEILKSEQVRRNIRS